MAQIHQSSGGHAQTAVPGGIVLRVELIDTTPMVMRRLLMHSDVTLDDLHHILQVAMGWHDRHSYEFIVVEQPFRFPDEDDSPLEVKPGQPRRKLLRWGASETDLFRYVYDLGDNWEHRIVIERFEPMEPDYPGWVLGGQYACPPEDCGGVGGFRAALGSFREPGSLAAREFLAWAGEDFDPNRFDRHAANAALSRLAWNRWIAPPRTRRR